MLFFIDNKETNMSEKYIKNISEKGNAIIVGRGANSILKEYNSIIFLCMQIWNQR